MVALLQNSQTRENQATQHKLNATADGVADLMEHVSARYDDAGLKRDFEELRSAVGLEPRESTTHNAKWHCCIESSGPWSGRLARCPPAAPARRLIAQRSPGSGFRPM